MILFYLLTAVLVVIDQVIKYLTVSNLDLNEIQPVIENVFSLHYIQNFGASWGMMQGQMWLFIIITLVVVGVIIWTIHKEKQTRLSYIGFAFVLGGALGNFIDRLRLGYVVDMFRLEFIDFPIFNFADVALTVGVIVLAIHFIIEGED